MALLGTISILSPAALTVVAAIGAPAMLHSFVTKGFYPTLQEGFKPIAGLVAAAMLGKKGKVMDFVGAGLSPTSPLQTYKLLRHTAHWLNQGLSFPVKKLVAFVGKSAANTDGLTKRASAQTKSGLKQTKPRTQGNKSKKSRNCPSCFVGDTPVLMCSGKTKPIEEVKAGDWVWSKDAVTKDEGCFEVTHVHTNELPGVYELVLEDEDTGERDTVRVSGAHPFMTPGATQRIVEDLDSGDVVGARSGKKLRLVSKRWLGKKHWRVFNLTIHSYHTYFVGSVYAWVHNTEDCPVNLQEITDNTTIKAYEHASSNPDGSVLRIREDDWEFVTPRVLGRNHPDYPNDPNAYGETFLATYPDGSYSLQILIPKSAGRKGSDIVELTVLHELHHASDELAGLRKFSDDVDAWSQSSLAIYEDPMKNSLNEVFAEMRALFSMIQINDGVSPTILNEARTYIRLYHGEFMRLHRSASPSMRIEQSVIERVSNAVNADLSNVDRNSLRLLDELVWGVGFHEFR